MRNNLFLFIYLKNFLKHGSNVGPSSCHACKHFQENGVCVAVCSPGSYMNNSVCLPCHDECDSQGCVLDEQFKNCPNAMFIIIHAIFIYYFYM